jgi:glycosyltransferase involved in cell wall biosynthesis
VKLIIQIPAYNEEATIGRTLADLPRRIDGMDSIETLVIDDGSTDHTVEAARKAGVTHVVRLRNHRGLSTAFLAGVDACLRLGADIIVNTDADNQYHGADIIKLVAPIVRGSAEVVIGDRDVKSSPHMGPGKRLLQRFGSWTVGIASGLSVPDVTSGLRAFSREAAFQINVFNPFTYTLETIIQAGNRNLDIQSIRVATNPPARPSRLYRGLGTYLWKSVVTIFRIYTVYRPLKTFVGIGAILFGIGVVIGLRFLIHYFAGNPGGHIQSLILAAVFLIVGFQTALIGLVADLISVNRRISEELLVRLRKMGPRSEHRGRERRPDRRPARGEREESPQQEPQWVWLIDEAKLEPQEGPPRAEAATPLPTGRRRRRRRRGGPRPRGEDGGLFPAEPNPPDGIDLEEEQ